MGNRRAAWLLLLSALTVGEGVASAKEESIAAGLVRGSVNRARRSVAFGPSVGLTPTYATADTGFDTALTFGLGIYLFKIPIVPGIDEIKEIVQERVKAKVQERLKDALLRGEKPTEDDLARWGREIYEEVKADLLGRMNVRSKTFEKPRFALDLEGQYLFGNDWWETRMTFGFGVKSITFGPTLALRMWDSTGLALGGELALRALPSKSPRSPVIDVFVRMDFELLDRTDRGDELSFGLRFLLDVI